MVKKLLAKIQVDFHPGFLFSCCLIMLSGFLMVGCALFQTNSRTFPDFVAVIAQPGDTFSSLALEYLDDSSMDSFISEFNGITSLNPGQELIIPLKPYGRWGLNFRAYQTVPVLCYHKFSRNKADMMTVTENAFEEQMRFLKENGYQVISMDEFFDFIEFGHQIPLKSVVIAIDDGWRSTYDTAFPILKKYGFAATLFVYTDLITGSNKTLDWNLIREMSENGIDIQCHSKTHRNLNWRMEQESFREYFEAIKKELTDSAKIIKDQLDIDVRYLAYPYGDTNHLVIVLLMKLGYRGGLTVERGGNPFFVHDYRVNRSMIYGSFDLKEFEKTLTVFSRKALK